jgi:hypothetical protein
VHCVQWFWSENDVSYVIRSLELHLVGPSGRDMGQRRLNILAAMLADPIVISAANSNITCPLIVVAAVHDDLMSAL